MAHLTKDYVRQLYDTYGELRVLDDIIHHRGTDSPPSSILGYPRNEDNVHDYENFSGQQLDQFVDSGVKYFLDSGLKPNERKVVGIFAPSNVDFVVTFFALSRLGYAVLCISLRLPPVAIINILKQANCNTIIRGDSPQIASTIEAVKQDWDLKSVLAPSRTEYGRSREPNELFFVRDFDRDSETNEIGLVMHSSGSTGLPKPVFLSHRNVLMHAVQGAGMNNFGALPLYHMYGLSTTLQAMYMGKTANLPSASLPMTADTLMSAIETTQPEIFHGVPYALALLADHPRGMSYLKSAKIVTAAGARTPDELGDRLTNEGVNFGVVFGTTEAGLLGDTMRRQEGDDTWSYVRIYPAIRDSIHMDPLGDGQYECVYLKSHPGLSPTTANSDDPAPGSWRSKDVFEPHPTLPDVWKCITRLDDRVTLSNGEKVLPLPIEGRIRQNTLIREAVVFGIDRALPGVLLFKDSDDLSDEAFLDAVWPTIADANTHAEAFSQITREMVGIMGSDAEYPKTDKGSIIRAQVYRKFADKIDELYDELENVAGGSLRLDLAGLEEFLADTYKDIVGSALESVDTDFFNTGIDSLKAIQMRRIIQKTLDLNGKQLSSNVVYECGNVRALARHLNSLRKGDRDGDDIDDDNDYKTQLMKDLVQKYSNFGETAILSGATGSLGAHTLAQMVVSDSIIKVYCLVRGQNPMGRVLASLKERGIELDAANKSKIVALSADFSRRDLGVGDKMMEQFKSEVSLIIHLAWPVNFSIPLQSFEPHLVGLQTLLSLSLAVYSPEPARIFFASSISTAENTPTPALIPNAPIDNFNHAINMGYAQSKLVGEHMILNAARNGARSYVLRIGQIVGDRQNGAWNDTEFIPLMIRSALTLKSLPSLGEDCSWFPVDLMATTILEIDKTLQAAPRPCTLNRTTPPIIYNLSNPHIFTWHQLLVELQSAGLDFTAVPYGEWLEGLRGSAARGEVDRNPAVKLIDHFEERHVLSERTSATSGSAIKPNGAKANGAQSNGAKTNGAESNGVKTNGAKSKVIKASDTPARIVGVTFDTKAMLQDSQILRQPPNIIKDGYVRKFLSTWLKKWVV